MKFFRSFFITLFMTAIFLFLLEVILQYYYYIRNDKIWIWEGITIAYEAHPYLSAVPKKNISLKDKHHNKVVTFDSFRRRISTHSLQKDTIGKTRIACLGGSSTFCAGVTDSATWPFMLQKKLGDKFIVYNFGVSGYSTVENIIQMALTVPEVKPQIVIFYEGWNDLHNYHHPAKSADYFWHGMYQKQNLNLISGLAYYKQCSAILRFIISMHEKLFHRRSNNEMLKTTPDLFIDSLYTRNIKTLKILSSQLNAISIFIPQVLNLSKFNEAGKSYSWTPYIENTAMPALLNHFNDLILQLPKDSTTIIFNKVREKNLWNDKDFVDEGHFSYSGNKKFSDLLGGEIIKLNKTKIK